jgi:Zn-finger protein
MNPLIPLQAAVKLMGAKNVKMESDQLSFLLNHQQCSFYGLHTDSKYPHWGICAYYKIGNSHVQIATDIQKEPPIWLLVQTLESEEDTKVRERFIDIGIMKLRIKQGKDLTLPTLDEQKDLEEKSTALHRKQKRHELAIIAQLKALNCFPTVAKPIERLSWRENTLIFFINSFSIGL